MHHHTDRTRRSSKATRESLGKKVDALLTGYIRRQRERRAVNTLHNMVSHKTVRKFEIKYSGIKQQSVSDFKRKYNEVKRTNPFVLISEIETKKRGRPSLLHDELMKKSIDIIKAVRLKAAPVSYAVRSAVARVVMMAHDRNLLVENGGH